MIRQRRFQFSILSILVLMAAVSVALSYRLSPRREAQAFVERANGTSPRGAMGLLPSETRATLREYIFNHNYPDWDATVVSTPWEVIWSGQCDIAVTYRWATVTSAGVDELRMTFTPGEPPDFEFKVVTMSSLPLLL